MATMGGSRAVVMVVLLLLLCVATGFLRGVCAQQPAPAPVAGGVGAPYVAMAPQSPTMAPAPAPGPLWPDCEGVDIVYVTSYTEKIYPYLNDTPWLQPYKFEASVTLTNMGYSTVEGWAMGIQYQHHEILVDAAAGAVVLASGAAYPVDVSNGTILTASPPDNLKNAIETAGDLTQVQRTFIITGTEFGVKRDPMPINVNITNTGYNCSAGKLYGNNTMHVCCLEQNNNITLTGDNIFLPSETGNITITYDVAQAYTNNYQALVTISNDSPIARIDNWNLSWTWQEGEFINQMQGAQTRYADLQVCLNGLAGQTYQSGLDVNKAVSCSVSPQILDLPVDRTNDTSIGNVQYCCKNGTILPAIIDPSKSKAAFTMIVYKVPPGNAKLSHIVPPTSFKIGDGYFQCGLPRLIAPTVYPDTNNLLRSTTAYKTWQVTCNVTGEVKRTPTCCLSFSNYYNDSISPCRTCACGCPEASQPPVCSTNASAMLLPFGALTLAPVNRTNQILAWAGLTHKPVPNPLPCPDNCGVNINWHIVSDYRKGWSARMTLLNWSNVTYPDWYAVVEMDKAYPGLQQAYSFNATKIPPALSNSTINNTFILQGLPGLNYLIAEQNLSSGKLQSIISFTKDPTPGIEVMLGDGYPTKLWFNGDECVLPEFIPTSTATMRTLAPTILMSALVSVISVFFVMLG